MGPETTMQNPLRKMKTLLNIFIDLKNFSTLKVQ